MFAQRTSVSVTTAAGGGATAYSGVLNGELSKIEYVKTDFADGVDFTITDENTGESLWTEENVNASTVRAPRQATHGSDGAAALYAGGGAAVRDKFALANTRVKIVIANGGAVKTGTFWITTV